MQGQIALIRGAMAKGGSFPLASLEGSLQAFL